jgi:hypothetical protein
MDGAVLHNIFKKPKQVLDTSNLKIIEDEESMFNKST